MEPSENQKEFGKIIGLNIKKIRGVLTQQQFSDIIGIHPIQISRYERGLSVPNDKTLNKIAHALGVTIPDLARIQTDPKSVNAEKNIDDQMIIKKLKIESKNLPISDRRLIKDFIKIFESKNPKMRHLLQTTMRALLESMEPDMEN